MLLHLTVLTEILFYCQQHMSHIQVENMFVIWVPMRLSQSVFRQSSLCSYPFVAFCSLTSTTSDKELTLFSFSEKGAGCRIQSSFQLSFPGSWPLGLVMCYRSHRQCLFLTVLHLQCFHYSSYFNNFIVGDNIHKYSSLKEIKIK